MTELSGNPKAHMEALTKDSDTKVGRPDGDETRHDTGGISQKRVDAAATGACGCGAVGWGRRWWEVEKFFAGFYPA